MKEILIGVIISHIFINAIMLYFSFYYGAIDKHKGFDKVRSIILTLFIGWLVLLLSNEEYLD